MKNQCAYGAKNSHCLSSELLKDLSKQLKLKYVNDDVTYKQILKKIDGKNTKDIIEHFNLNEDDILKPEKPDFYLSNTSIDKVMKQMEKAHPEFKSFGAVPYDFAEEPYGGWYENCKGINNFKLSSPYKHWGFVVNLDESTKRGSHWVCLFMTKTNKKVTVEYFDSYGTNRCRSMVDCDKDNVPVEIREYVEKLRKQSEKAGLSFEFNHNKKRHQRKNNECGMYCLYYMLNRVNGVEYTDKIDAITDDKMTYLRNVLFRNDVCGRCGKPMKN